MTVLTTTSGPRRRAGHGILIGVLFVESAAFTVGWWANRASETVINPTHLGFGELLRHNGQTGLLIAALGLVTFGVAGLLLAGFTFYSLGATVAKVLNSAGPSPLLTGVAPHALPELSAITLCAMSGCLGLRLLVGRQAGNGPTVRRTLLVLLRWLTTAMALIAVAALIESRISHV